MKRAVIICSLDGYANSVKPAELQKMLNKHSYKIDVISTTSLGRLGTEGFSRWLPAISFTAVKLYLLEVVRWLAKKSRSGRLRRWVNSVITMSRLKTRGLLLQRIVGADNYDLLICEYGLDEAVLAGDRLAKIQILDLAAPFAEEMYYGGELTSRAFHRLKSYEAELYGRADYLSFHWWTYADFVKRTKYDGGNFIDASYGVSQKDRSAHYRTTPRVVFLGFLAGSWVNVPLLETLSALYEHIDVYGGPPPAAGTRINYKGYLPAEKMAETLAGYQFGLITISDDELRKHSFSSKQLEYYSYGLPVLTPAWRPDRILDSGAVYYDTETFLTVLERATEKSEWQQLSRAAQATADSLAWGKALAPIERVIRD